MCPGYGTQTTTNHMTSGQNHTLKKLEQSWNHTTESSNTFMCLPPFYIPNRRERERERERDHPTLDRQVAHGAGGGKTA